MISLVFVPSRARRTRKVLSVTARKNCAACRKQFTVKVGTVFEHARMPLHQMLQAVHLIMSSKKGISSHQLSRTLEVQYKTAWFLVHRIREAMRSGDLARLGSGGGAVEVDETYFGQRKGVEKARAGHAHKIGVLVLVDRNSGTMRSFTFDKNRANEITRSSAPTSALKPVS